MTRQAFFFILVSLSLLISCNSLTNHKTTADNLPIDTTKSFKIANYWVTPKPTFDFNSLNKSLTDTLDIVTCAEYVYYPFGLLKDKYALKKGLLKNFNIIDRVGKMGIGTIEFQILKLNLSRLIIYFDNNTEASKHSYIFKGEIKDSAVNFSSNIKIGMSLENFYTAFFYNFPTKLESNFKVIVFESCVQDIKHIYNFDKGKLISVKFVTDSHWKVDY